MKSLRPLLITAALAVGLSVLVSACSDDDIITADQRVKKDNGSDIYKPDQKQGSDGYDGGVPDKQVPDLGEDVGLSCKVNFDNLNGAFAASCTTKKSTCYGNQVKIGVDKHNLVGKNGKSLTFVCFASGNCVSNETLDNPQKYSVTFSAKSGSSSCGTYTTTGTVK